MNIVLILAEPIPGPAYEMQTNGYENIAFEYDPTYRACVKRFPLALWKKDDFTLARQVLCQPLAIPILIDFEESPQAEPSTPPPPLSGLAVAGQKVYAAPKARRGRPPTLPPQQPATEQEEP